MPIDHEIKPGEHLVRIAAANRFHTYKTIWDSSDNGPLKEKCENPNVLLPGAHVQIPDITTKTVDVPTEQTHKFVVESDALDLVIILHDENDKPIDGKTCEVLDDKNELTTDGDGQLKAEDLSFEREIGILTFLYKEVDLSERGKDPDDAPDDQKVFTGTEEVERRFVLAIGGLDPVSSPSGIQGRLNNLGYYAGDIGFADQDPLALKCAIEEFEVEHDLKPKGDATDTAMQSKLKKVHGC